MKITTSFDVVILCAVGDAQCKTRELPEVLVTLVARNELQKGGKVSGNWEQLETSVGPSN